MTDQENTTIIGDDEIINDEIEESEQGNNGFNREVKRRRRLTPEETRILSEIYEHTQKPNSVLRNRLAQELGMSSRQIQIWFQNRRAKIKRDVNDPLGTDSTSKLYYTNDPAHPYYMQYPPGTISNTIQNGGTRPIGMLNIASKPILPVATMNGVYPPKQYPIGMTQPMNGFPMPVTTMNFTNQTQSAVPLQSQQGNINYGYTLRSQGIQQAKPMPIQNSYIQPTTAGQTRSIQRIIPGNPMMPMQQPQQQIRTANQLSSSSVPPMYTQSTSQMPIYTTAPNPAVPSYPANATQLSSLQNISYPGQKTQPIDSRNPLYMNQMNYPTTQTSQGSAPLAQNNIYVSNVSNVYDINKRTTAAAATTMVYSQNVIPASNIVNTGIPSSVTLAPNSSAVITSTPISRSVTSVPSQMNKMVQNPLNPMMISPDNKNDLTKKIPITTIVSSIPTMTSIIPNQQYPGNISKLASTGMPTSPIKAIINSSINSKVAAKAAALKQENAMNQYNINNNIMAQASNNIINANNDKLKNSITTTQSNISADKSSPKGTTSTANTSVNVAKSVNTANTSKINGANVANTTNINSTTPKNENSKVNETKTTVVNSTNDINVKANEVKDNNLISKAVVNNNQNNIISLDQTNDNNNSVLNPINKNEENAENKSIDVINTEDITKIDNVGNLNILDTMLYNPKTKASESGEMPLNTDMINDLDANKDQNNKFLKDLYSLYDNNETMKWLEDDASWNQATQLSQFPLPNEDKKNQKENESKDLGSLTDLNTNDESLNDNNTQLWLSDDIDYLLQSENFQV